MVRGALLFMKSQVCVYRVHHSDFDLQDNNGEMRRQLLTGEQRPSNLICVTLLRLTRQINSGRLGKQGEGGRGEGELGYCTGTRTVREREGATSQKQIDPWSS